MNNRRALLNSRLTRLSGFALILTCVTPAVLARDHHDSRSREELVDLTGNWRFTVGDDLRWAKTDFDDKRWSRIDVPSYWENEGYEDYNGFAWYRRTFTFDEDTNQSTYLL